MSSSDTQILNDKVFRNLFFHVGKLQPGDKFILELMDFPDHIATAIVEKAIEMELLPIVSLKSNSIISTLAQSANADYYKLLAEIEIELFKKTNTIIGLRPISLNTSLKNVSSAQRKVVLDNFIRPVHFNYRNKNMQWVYYRIPGEENTFLQEYIEASQLNYNAFHEEMLPLAKLLTECKKVHLKAPNGTDLTFNTNVPKIGIFVSSGKHNLPDGEIFTAPILHSVNGTIKFNVPTTYYGKSFEEITFVFKDGEIVDCSAGEHTQEFSEIINTDKGSRFVGEFAIGLNPFVHTPINDLLYDEKMYGSVHLALGNAYDYADNGNRSSIHWDIILCMRPEYGGGEVWFDDTLIQKDGIFVLPELSNLNPDKLKTLI